MDLRVGLIGLVKSLSSTQNMTRLLQAGVSRVRNRSDLGAWQKEGSMGWVVNQLEDY